MPFPRLTDEELIKEVYLANTRNFSESQFVSRFVELVEIIEQHEDEIIFINDEHNSEVNRLYNDIDDLWSKNEKLQEKMKCLEKCLRK